MGRSTSVSTRLCRPPQQRQKEPSVFHRNVLCRISRWHAETALSATSFICACESPSHKQQPQKGLVSSNNIQRIFGFLADMRRCQLGTLTVDSGQGRGSIKLLPGWPLKSFAQPHLHRGNVRCSRQLSDTSGSSLSMSSLATHSRR